MIPAPFGYVAAASVGEAAGLLRQHGEEAKLLAGGHSLIPLMRLRLAQPTVLVDISSIRDLSYVRVDGDRVRIGAMTRHVDVEESAEVRRTLPLLAEVAGEIGDAQVRNRGTMGGAIAHADSAGDYPTIALMLDAEITTDRRTWAARDFFQDLFTTSLEPDEIVLEVAFPVAPGPHRYVKFRRRRCDWAIVAAAAQQTGAGWRIGLTNVGPTPVRATAVEEALAGGASPPDAAKLADQGLSPSSDLRASAEYKRHMATVLTQRAIEQAQA